MPKYEVTRLTYSYITVEAEDVLDAQKVADDSEDYEWEVSPDYEETIEETTG